MTLAPALARGVIAGLAAELLAAVVLSAVWFAMLGDAGADWDTGGFRAAVTITGAIVAVLAGAVGGVVGVLAARGVAPRRSDVLVAGAAGPVVFGLLVPLIAAAGSASLPASLLVAVALAGGGALGAIVAVRRGAADA